MDIQLWPDRPEPSTVLVGALLAGLVIMGVTAQLAFVAESFQEEVWLARAEVEYRGDSLVETIAVTMSSPGIWGPIAVENGVGLKEFEKRYRAEVVDGTQALSVEFEDPDPELARQIVSQVIESFLLQFTIVDESEQSETLGTYLEKLRSTESDLVFVLDERNELTRNEQIDPRNELIAVRQAITQVLLRLDGRAQDVTALEEHHPRVISDPYVLPEPIEPEPLKTVVIGAGAGGLLAVSAAFFMFHADENARREDESNSLEGSDERQLAA